uniref:Ig-like domain-containing protein n=1 Tax=Mola mola TaxID=94237 RepID=A0A3Q3WIE9_MOLML
MSARNKNQPSHLLLPSVPPSLDGAGATEDVTIVRENSVSLLCVADGTPTPTVSWFKEGLPLIPDPHLKFLNLNTSVQITLPLFIRNCEFVCYLSPQWLQLSRKAPRQCQYTLTSQQCWSAS